MKSVKVTLGFFVLLSFFGLNEAIGQWAPNGAHIFNTNAGNVGIGTNTPATLLHVGKNMTEPTIRVQNLGGSGGATYQMIDNTSGADWKFKATNTGGFKIRDNAFALDVVTIEANSAANAIYVNDAGNVGLNTTTPSTRLHIETGDLTIHDFYPFIFLDNTSVSGNAGIRFDYQGADNAWIFFDDGEDLLRINADNAGGSRNDLVIKSDGRICMGTTAAATGYKLSVNGKVTCTEVLVEALANWPDYVFQDGYELMSLEELEKNIIEQKHLPGLPSAAEVESNGFELADMQKRVLQKVEELTLYTIEQGKQIQSLQEKINKLEKENQGLKNKRSRR
jgi:hypothetical protein